MAPEERRAAILAAVVPVVLDRGPAATTRELAQAAGVAEGTLFRVFQSKDDLVVEAARSVFGRTDHLDELAAIDPRSPLDERLERIVAIWQQVVGRVMRVYIAFATCDQRHRLGDPRTAIDPDVVAEAERIIAGLLAPDADRLRLPVSEVQHILGGLVMTSVHPMGLGAPLTPTALVDLLLHGVLTAPDPENPLTPTPREPAGSTAYPTR